MSPINVQKETPWQEELKHAVSSPAVLLNMLGINHTHLTLAPSHFPLRVPHSFIKRMIPGDPHCPLLRQVLTTPFEFESTASTCKDPLKEQSSSEVPGILDKFGNRILLTLTGACAIHCRYCFRQYYPYEENTLSPSRWGAVLEYIEARPQIVEVILSGGDPLSFKNALLKKLLNELSAIKHLKMIRLHTRFPIAIPSRLDAELFELLQAQTLPITMVLHVNHPNEIDECLSQRLRKFRECGVTLLSQSVLLKGINDDLDTLVTLSHTLYRAGVLPYYMNQLDLVQGTHQHAVPLSQIQTLYQGMLESLPGFLVPRFVKEIPGRRYKVPLSVS